MATVPEAIVMATGGIDGILLCSPIATPSKADRIAALARDGRSLMVAVDHPQQVEMYAKAAASAGSKLGVLVDLDVGDHRIGIEPGEPAVRLAEAVMQSKHLMLRGLQAFRYVSGTVFSLEVSFRQAGTFSVGHLGALSTPNRTSLPKT